MEAKPYPLAASKWEKADVEGGVGGKKRKVTNLINHNILLKKSNRR